MISRQWTGVVKPERAGEYIKHLETETFPSLRKIHCFIDAQILTREIDIGVEFLIVTTWESLEVIKKFTGEDISKAVVPQVAQDMMVEFDEKVKHYEVIKIDNFG